MEEHVTISLDRFISMKEIMKKQSSDVCRLTKEVADLEKSLLKVHRMFSDPEVYRDVSNNRDVCVYNLGMKNFMELAGRLEEDSEIRIHVAPAHYVTERKMVE